MKFPWIFAFVFIISSCNMGWTAPAGWYLPLENLADAEDPVIVTDDKLSEWLIDTQAASNHGQDSGVQSVGHNVLW